MFINRGHRVRLIVYLVDVPLIAILIFARNPTKPARQTTRDGPDGFCSRLVQCTSVRG